MSINDIPLKNEGGATYLNHDEDSPWDNDEVNMDGSDETPSPALSRQASSDEWVENDTGVDEKRSSDAALPPPSKNTEMDAASEHDRIRNPYGSAGAEERSGAPAAEDNEGALLGLNAEEEKTRLQKEAYDAEAMAEMERSRGNPDHPPPRYIDGMHGNMAEARKRWKLTLEHRIDTAAEGLLSEDNPQYVPIRQLFSHFFHGHGRSGSVCLYVRPGKSDFKTLFKSTYVRDNSKPGGESPPSIPSSTVGGDGSSSGGNSGDCNSGDGGNSGGGGDAAGGGSTTAVPQRLVTHDDLVRHFTFMLEALFQHWGPSVERKVGERDTPQMQKMVAVFDFEGFSMSEARSVYGIFKRVVQLLERHYVGRADRIVIVNAPNFRNIAFLVFPLVPKEVKEKIEILGKNYHKRLAEILVPEEIPREYGGTVCEIPVGQWYLERHINHMYGDPTKRWPTQTTFDSATSDDSNGGGGSSSAPPYTIPPAKSQEVPEVNADYPGWGLLRGGARGWGWNGGGGDASGKEGRAQGAAGKNNNARGGSKAAAAKGMKGARGSSSLGPGDGGGGGADSSLSL